MPPHLDTDQLLDAAEELFYEKGFQAVGMDELRKASGLSLKRIYSIFKGKDDIAIAMLNRRDKRWLTDLQAWVAQATEPHTRVLSIFDWLDMWLNTEGHRGCAWINAFGELGGTNSEVAQAVRQHKTGLRTFINKEVAKTGASTAVANGIFLLMEGCLVTAGIAQNSSAASEAKEVASLLLKP